MKKLLIFTFLILFSFSVIAQEVTNSIVRDTNLVIKLNKQGFGMRLTNPDQTVAVAGKALAVAQKLGYKEGIGESYRVMGVGNYYLEKPVKAIDDFLTALNYFKQINDLQSQGKVYNNIGNLYRYDDYDAALDFYQKGLVIAARLSDDHSKANLYLNIGNIYFYKNSFNQALDYYNKSDALFSALNDSVNMVQCMQNKGSVYFNLHRYDLADTFLSEANKRAKQLDMNYSVASTDLTRAELYMAENKFDDAEKTITEGITFSEIAKSEKVRSDLKHTGYELELRRKHYERAVAYLYDIYKQDSTTYLQSSSAQTTLVREQFTQQARQKENELLLQRQQYDRVKFWGLVVVTALLMALVGGLISNVKRKAKTNIRLTGLNAEVSRQKDNLDRINHHLEEIIDERTKDLQVKNKKLSEHSSYLSHQIRGPIATLKGLMNLEKEGLVDQPECIRMMNKCVGEIDDKIIEMSDMLHDPGRGGF